MWRLLTEASDMARWNSTVTNISGRVALGERLQIRVPISERVFKVTVTELDRPRRMVWADGHKPMFRGVRVYTLEPRGPGTHVTMTETLSGLMVPMIARSLPDFALVFERYVSDLKREAERAAVHHS